MRFFRRRERIKIAVRVPSRAIVIFHLQFDSKLTSCFVQSLVDSPSQLKLVHLGSSILVASEQ